MDPEGPAAQPFVLFLDDGGVLNDNARRAPEWRRLIGEFMPPRLGGTAEEWASGNQLVFPQVWERFLARQPDFTSYQEFHRWYAYDWVRAMCVHLGRTAPAEDAAVALYDELAT
jgi:hypothetical protein